MRRPFRLPAVLYVVALFALVVCPLLLSSRAAAQDNPVTPTPAPSKTPLPTLTVEPTPESLENTVAPAFESLNQSDLRVLTANVQRPNGLAWLDGELFASCTGDWTVYRMDDTTGETVVYINGVRNAHTMFAETDAGDEIHVWAPDYQSNSFLHLTRHGVEQVASNLSGPWGVARWDDESFLLTNLLGNEVLRVSRDGETESVVTGLMSPTGIAASAGRVYVGNNGSTRRSIEWYEPADEPIDASGPPDAGRVLVSGLQNVTGLALGPDAHLYFAYALGTRGVVGRVDPEECIANGGCTNAEVEIVVLTELAAPLAGLTVSPENRLYVHTMFSPEIYWAQLPGTVAVADSTAEAE